MYHITKFDPPVIPATFISTPNQKYYCNSLPTEPPPSSSINKAADSDGCCDSPLYIVLYSGLGM